MYGFKERTTKSTGGYHVGVYEIARVPDDST